MTIHHWALACGVLLLARPTWAHRISCPPGDNSVIQACLDRAQPGDELVFAGDYRIDPSQPYVVLQNTSHIRLLGDAADPPVFRCRVEAGGRPLMAPLVNDAIQLRADGERVENILVAGIAFEGCGTAITVATANEGSFFDVEIREATISNVYYGVIVDAAIEQLVIRDSQIRNAERGIAIGSVSLNESRRVEITGNVLQGLTLDQPITDAQIGISTSEMLDGKIAGNVISGFSRSFGLPGIGVALINIGDAADLDVVHNVIQEVGVGISLGGPAVARGHVSGNRVEGASTAGVVLRFGATGRRIGVNELIDNAVDVRLTGVEVDDPTIGNVVQLECGQTYEDFGIDNRIVINHR
jgi:hypothetical protein